MTNQCRLKMAIDGPEKRNGAQASNCSYISMADFMKQNKVDCFYYPTIMTINSIGTQLTKMRTYVNVIDKQVMWSNFSVRFSRIIFVYIGSCFSWSLLITDIRHVLFYCSCEFASIDCKSWKMYKCLFSIVKCIFHFIKQAITCTNIEHITMASAVFFTLYIRC